MEAQSLVWFTFFVVSLVVMLVLVPSDKLRRLLAFGLIGGSALAYLVQWVAVNWLRLWGFNHLAFLSVQRIPLGLVLAWFPSTVIFGHYFEYMHSFLTRLLYILGFALLGAVIEYGFVLAGYHYYLNWSVVNTFLLGAAIHTVLATYLSRVHYAQPENLEV